MSTEEEVRNLVCELCRNFFNAGWVTGTGGSISIRLGDKIFMTPSGVQKERIKPEELFVVNKQGDVVTPPACRADGSRPKLSDCSPLFLHAYNQRDAGELFLVSLCRNDFIIHRNLKFSLFFLDTQVLCCIRTVCPVIW